MHRSALMVAIVLAGSSLAAPAVAHAAPGGSPVAVSIGDSYISGEAGRWKANSGDLLPGHAGTDRAHRPFTEDDPSRVYGTSAGTCDRSDVAPILSAELPGLTPVNLACAGARTYNVLRGAAGGVVSEGESKTQNDQLADVARAYDVELIALSIGGNDLGFTPILQSCIQSYLTRGVPCSRTTQATVDAALPGVEADIEAVIADTRATMTAAGYAPGSYRFILQTYPSPLADRADLRYSQQDLGRINVGFCPFYDKDADWAAHTLVPSVAAAQARAAKAQGVQLLDLGPAAEGHQLCDKDATQPVGYGATPSPSKSEWIRFIDLQGQGSSGESLHPNFFGQQALGRCLALAYAASGDVTCSAVPRQGPGAVHL